MRFPFCNLLLGAKIPYVRLCSLCSLCHTVCDIRPGTIFKQKGTSHKKKELLVNSTSDTFQGKYENFDKTLTVSIYPKIT